MSPLLFIAVALAGGCGAACRFALDGWIALHISNMAPRLPFGTILINVSGSLAIGLLSGFALGRLVPEAVQLIAGTGFLGGYTTFSTASYETVRLLRERKPLLGFVNGVGTLVIAAAAAGLGMWLGTSV